MITPHKYLNLEQSVLNISAVILKQLQVSKSVKYDELCNFITSSVGENAKIAFPNAISFLFLVGKIEYHQQIDTFELL